MPGVQTRGRGSVPLVEIPARRRRIEQSLAVPLFQNEPPPGDEEIDDAVAVRGKSAMWCIANEATTASNGPGSVKSSKGMRRKRGPSGASGSTATMSYPAAAIAEVRSPTGPQPISRTRAGAGADGEERTWPGSSRHDNREVTARGHASRRMSRRGARRALRISACRQPTQLVEKHGARRFRDPLRPYYGKFRVVNLLKSKHSD